MRKKTERYLKNGCRVLFLLYLLCLLKIILFKYRSAADTFSMLAAGERSGFRSYNLIPFQSIAAFLRLMGEGSFSRGFHNLIGNLFVFAPFGYFLPLLHPRCRKWQTVLTGALLLSGVLEVLQYVLYLGSADIDDVLLNGLGAVCGFWFFLGIRKCTPNRRAQRYAATMVLSVFGFWAAGYLAVHYFGLMFGLSGGKSQPLRSAERPAVAGTRTDDDDDRFREWPGEARNADAEDAARRAEDAEEQERYGMILEWSDPRIVINRIHVEDVGNGIGIARIDLEEPDLQTVWVTETTKYLQKDIYDVNGEKVELREAAKDDLKRDANIQIRGYQREDRFYAEEITIENFLF